jgi:hypothetical protein
MDTGFNAKYVLNDLEMHRKWQRKLLISQERSVTNNLLNK